MYWQVTGYTGNLPACITKDPTINAGSHSESNQTKKGYRGSSQTYAQPAGCQPFFQTCAVPSFKQLLTSSPPSLTCTTLTN
eukprot:scaffold187125_cov18-Tisochrysis_lutea.AAC.2